MRHCGACQLCCRLLPVRAIDKPSNTKCKYQKFGVGCTVYRRLESIAPECRLWNCRWLVNDDAADLRRPDRSHYVVDILPERIYFVNNASGEHIPITAVQIWVDQNYRDAYHDPALRAWIERRAQTGEIGAAIIRYSGKEGFVLFPPAVTGAGWHEDHTPPNPEVKGLWDVVEQAHATLDKIGVPPA